MCLTSVHLAITGKGSLGHLGVDGVVLSGHARDGLEEHVQCRVAGCGVIYVSPQFLFSSVDRNIL